MYCNFEFSVSSNFIVISACSNKSTGFLKSQSSSRIEYGCGALFALLIIVVVVLESSSKFLSSLGFYNLAF